MKVRQALMKFVSPVTPPELKARVANRTFTDEEIAPEDEVTLLFILCHDRDPSISAAAKKSFEEYPPGRLVEALEKKLDPLVIRRVVELRKDDEAVLTMAFLNPWADDETLKVLAETGPDEVVGLLSDDRERFLEKPFLLDAFKRNPLAPYIVISEIEAMIRAEAHDKREAPRRAEMDAERLSVPKELLDEHKADEQNAYKLIQSMTMAQKVKLALSGNKSARELLIKDSNKMISLAVLKNPRMTEDEVLRLTSAKGTPEDLIRHVARNKEWLKNYNVKMGIVANPKTPLTISIKLLDHLYDKDLKNISKSKNVPSVLASTARRKIEIKAKK